MMLIESPKKTLLSYVSALELTNSADAPQSLRKFASILAKADNVRTKTFVSDLSKAPVNATSDGTGRLKELLPSLRGLAGFLKDVGAKKSLVKDVGLILDLVRQLRELSFNEFEALVKRHLKTAPRWMACKEGAGFDEKRVEDYLKRLEQALGKDHDFRKIYCELEADTRITRLEAVEIASRFLSPIAPSTPRKKALQTVMHRHEKLMDNRIASRAIGGIRAHELQ